MDSDDGTAEGASDAVQQGAVKGNGGSRQPDDEQDGCVYPGEGRGKHFPDERCTF